MNKLSGSGFASRIVAPAAQTSGIDQAQARAGTSHLDLILISVAEGFPDEHPLCAQAKYSGQSFQMILVDEAGQRDLPAQIEALHTNAVLGPGTQVIIMMHGGINNGRHLLGTAAHVSIDTCDLIRSLRCPPGSSKSTSQWKGVVHLISCHIAAVGEAMRDNLGYCVLYGGHEKTLCADGVDTAMEMMRVFGLSRKDDGSAINATALFPYLAGFTGEPITLTGNGRCDFIHPFDAVPAVFDNETAQTEREMRLLFSRLDHGACAEVDKLLGIMGPHLASLCYAGTLPLHIAAGSTNESGEKIQSLLDAGADINAVDNKGGSALMDACLFNNAKAVACLLEYGADPLGPNDNGVTPLEQAFVLENTEIVRLMLKHFLDDLQDIHVDEFLSLSKKIGPRTIVERLFEPWDE